MRPLFAWGRRMKPIGFFMTAPPLRTFRTAPRGQGEAEMPASYLGTAFTAEGFLDTDGDIHIHGRVFGRVCADRLVLGSGGYLEGDVVARDVHIGGRLTGRIFALNVTLDSSASMLPAGFSTTKSRSHKGGHRVDALHMPLAAAQLLLNHSNNSRTPDNQHIHTRRQIA